MRIVRKGFVIIGLLASSAAYAGAPGWSLSETSGQVSVVSTGIVKVATRGGAVNTGDVINTGSNGRAVLVRGGEYLVVSPNSRIRVADPAKSGGFTQIIEDFGNVIYKIKKMTMPHFAVETPFLAAVVKGTTFSVTVTEKGASVQVIEGRVEVATRDGGASFMVMPGDIGSVSATAPGRLNLQGRESMSIQSPTPAAAAAAVTASVEDSPVKKSDGDQARFDGAIVAPVGEGPVNLEAMSEGMVKGDSTMMAMVSMMAETSREMQTADPSTDRAPATSTVTNNTTVVEAAPGMITPPDVAEAGGKPPPTALPPAPAVPDPEVVPVPLPPVPVETATMTPPDPVGGTGGVTAVAPVTEVFVTPPLAPAPVVAASQGNGNNANGNAGGTGNSNGNSNGNGNGNGNGSNNGNSNTNRFIEWLTELRNRFSNGPGR